jgi:transposase
VLVEEQLHTQSLYHLGLMVAVMDKIGLMDKIDLRLPLSDNRGSKVTMGQRVAAMILNGLGFMDDRLYMFPEFLEDKPVQRFFGDKVEAAHFNDDALGRCLDAIHTYGITKLFSEITFEIGVEQNLLGKSARFDTTSLVVYGDYKEDESIIASEQSNTVCTKSNSKKLGETKTTEDAFRITYGYSKDGRPDLKQMILNLATTGKANLPIWMEAHSGNASDKVILQQAAERMKKFAAALKEAPSFLFVGDSAMYEACVEKAEDMLWLSRVPHTNKQSKEVLDLKDQELKWQECDNGYRISLIRNSYKEVEQRWLLVYSKQKYESEIITFGKRIKLEEKSMKKKLWHLSNEVFACEKDATKALKPLSKELKYHKVILSIEPVQQHVNKGRPKKEIVANVVGYRVAALVIPDDEKLEKHRLKLGRFILATNQLDKEQLSNEGMLLEYKEQMHTEVGFRFIKGDNFEVSNVFLKKPSRVAALMMVMTLCLMIYNLAQHMLRECLEANNATVPDYLQKPTQKPTMARVCKLFRSVHVVIISYDDDYQELVSNLNDVLRQIIRYYGSVAEKIYGLSG